jgi:1-pyrroline-5-carboxylate dehydrogenase
MTNAVIQIAKPSNEPGYSYAPRTPERKALKMQLEKMLGEEIEISLIIGGKEI